MPGDLETSNRAVLLNTELSDIGVQTLVASFTSKRTYTNMSPQIVRTAVLVRLFTLTSATGRSRTLLATHRTQVRRQCGRIVRG